MKKMIAIHKAKALDAIARQKALVQLIQTETRDFTPEEQTEFDLKDTEVTAAEKQITALEKMAANENRIGLVNTTETTPAVIKAVTGGGETKVIGGDLTGAQRVGLAAIASGKTITNPGHNALKHLQDMGYDALARDCETAKKTFAINVAGTADNLIFTPLSTDYIAALRNNSLFLKGNPTILPMANGSIKIPGGNGVTSASYQALGASIAYSQASTRTMSMAAKQLRALTTYDNYSAEVSVLAVATIVGDDLAMATVLSMDSGGLRGDGTGQNPAGVKTLIGAGQALVEASGVVAPTYVQCDAEAKRVLTKFRSSNIGARSPKWGMSNRTLTYLQFLRDTFGNFVYPGLQGDNPKWHGNYPVLVSEQIPSTLGVGTNESEIYLIDFGHVYLGETRALQLTTSKEASYINAGGTLTSSFDKDETVVRAMCAHDFGMRYIGAGTVITGVKWGA